jgi:very-short-patch-repair endonuclease
MANGSALGALSRLSATSLGVFRGCDAVALGVTRKQIMALNAAEVIERVLPDTYRMTAAPTSNAQSLRAALLWAGPDAVAAGLSAAETYGLGGVRARVPEIVVVSPCRVRSGSVIVHEAKHRAALRVRIHNNVRVTGMEPTLVALGAALGAEEFEIACEDARRRRLTSVPALHSYLDDFPARPGATAMRDLLHQLDPAHPARSVLEVTTRRLLVAHGLTEFVREFPLAWNGRTYLFDFAFPDHRTILETNGRRGHDDTSDYERDNEKWSVPGRYGWRIVFATWAKVTTQPAQLISELSTTLAAQAGVSAKRARTRLSMPLIAV